MNQTLALDIGGADIIQRLCVDLSQATNLEAGILSVVTTVERSLAPRNCQVTLLLAGEPRLLHGVGPVRIPDDTQRAALREGEIVVVPQSEAGMICFAPLRARRALIGWICLIDPTWSPEHESLLRMIAGQSGPALALLGNIGRRDDQAAQLQTLNEIGRLISSAFDLTQLFTAIHAVVQRVVEAPTFLIALYDAQTEELEPVYLIHEGRPQPTNERWSKDVGLAGVVVRERQPLCVSDYAKECERRGVQPQMLDGRIPGPAWVGVPLIAHDRLIGVIVLASSRAGYVYRQEHVNLLMTIAAHAAVALDRAWLYERAERQAQQLLVLNRIGRIITSSIDPQQVPDIILRQVTELLDAEESSLLLTDDHTGEMVFAYTTGQVGKRILGQRLPRGVGIAGYVAATGQSVIVNDVQSDERFYRSMDLSTGYTTRTLLAVPLRGVGGVEGVIEVLNRRDLRPFTVEDQRLLEALADYAVIALENARQFQKIDQALARRAQELARTNEQLQQHLRSLTALNAFGMAINTTLRSPHEILSMTARGIAEMTGAIGAMALLPDGEIMRPVVSIGLRMPLDERMLNVVHRVIATGRPDTLPPDPEAPGRAPRCVVLIVPLRATQRTLGCVCVAYTNALPEPSDRETVILFASQAAVAIESIDLFMAVRTARDQMASILASTREGILLIDTDGTVAVANAALSDLTTLDASIIHGLPVDAFLSRWFEAAAYETEECAALQRGIDDVLTGTAQFVAGELSGRSGQLRHLEWSVLRAQSSGDSHGGVLLVLRDITATKEAERMRHDLTHMIVHDLRSPLSGVMASIELMMRGVPGKLNDQQRHVLQIASTSAANMLDMINTLLDISRLEAGRMPIERCIGNIRDIIHDSVQRLASLALDRAITIRTEVEEDVPDIYADLGLISRIIQNLVSNAIKFSHRGGLVTVRAAVETADDGHPKVIVAVSDQGVGIAPGDRERIFAKFSQVGERRGGTGLGLAFCRQAIEAHGERIWVNSELGRGSTFFFTVPVAS
jgi:signal transduction histidine kinase/transcriptional regulator with GAF, ATPase, and Fis domain